VVFTGPIFSDVDPVYRGVDIPRRFFKVAAFIHEGELAATGYVVDQTPQLADLPDRAAARGHGGRPAIGSVPDLPSPIRDIAELTGLDLDQLIEVDRMPIAATIGAAPVGSTRRKLTAVEDLDLDFDLED
jgi:endonuclease G